MISSAVPDHTTKVNVFYNRLLQTTPVSECWPTDVGNMASILDNSSFDIDVNCYLYLYIYGEWPFRVMNGLCACAYVL